MRTRKRIFSNKHYMSGDGMSTSVWGPAMWHYLHVMSFNYPVSPTPSEKKHYRDFLLSLQYVLPCKYCRDNLKNNLEKLPITDEVLKSRHNFSKYMYDLHETVNKMLGKKSKLSFCQVRELYENFRSRCKIDKTPTKKEKGCTEPLYGKKNQCIVHIVPQTRKCKSLLVDKRCLVSKHPKQGQ